MKTIKLLFVGAVVAPFFAGCISHPMALSSVGPDPAGRTASGATGRLQVFSATEIRAVENTPTDYHGYFNPHTSYEVTDALGKTVKAVRNRASYMDETPDQVKLPAGHYKVVAQSSTCGLVSVPVVIEAGKTTVVHLDGNWLPSRKIASNQLVTLPNGEAVGWSDSVAQPAN